jgi:hypothetical protein
MIQELHEIALPQPVSYVPQTIGWLVAAILLLLLAAWGRYRWRRYRRANKYRVLALSRLSELEGELLTAGRRRALVNIPQLVKRVALQAYPREDIASLNGEAWLEFLGSNYRRKDFTDGPGRLLPILAYSSPHVLDGIRDKEISELTALLKKWIKIHK